MKSTDVMLLERCARGPVSFTHAPTVRGHTTKLVRSTLGPKQQAPLHALACAGYLSEKVTGLMDTMETTITYTLTALGREELGIHSRRAQPRNATPTPSESMLERESREPV